jgi:hypothetical protein
MDLVAPAAELQTTLIGYCAALGIGLLIGVERERRKDSSPNRIACDRSVCRPPDVRRQNPGAPGHGAHPAVPDHQYGDQVGVGSPCGGRASKIVPGLVLMVAATWLRFWWAR